MMKDHHLIMSCTLEVDLEIPEKIHKLTNYFPLAPAHKSTNGAWKLVPNLEDKKNYVVHVHHSLLRFFLEKGVVLKKYTVA